MSLRRTLHVFRIAFWTSDTSRVPRRSIHWLREFTVRQNEIENLVPGFRAAMVQEIGTHRGESAGGVANFVASVNGHKERYTAKINSIRF